MTFKSYFQHTEPIFHELQILNIYKVNDYITGLFMFRYFHLQSLPEIFTNYFLLIKKSITTTLEIHHLRTKKAAEKIKQNILLPIRELMFGIIYPHNMKKPNSMAILKNYKKLLLCI